MDLLLQLGFYGCSYLETADRAGLLDLVQLRPISLTCPGGSGWPTLDLRDRLYPTVLSECLADCYHVPWPIPE